VTFSLPTATGPFKLELFAQTEHTSSCAFLRIAHG
jgi:hypothetical protein